MLRGSRRPYSVPSAPPTITKSSEVLRRRPQTRGAAGGRRACSNHEQHGAPPRRAAAGPETGRRAATSPTGHGAAAGHLRGPPEDGPRRAAARRQCVKRAARRASAVQPKRRSAVRPAGRFVESRRPRFIISAVRGPRRPRAAADAEIRLGTTPKTELPQEAAGGLRRAAQNSISRRGAAATRRIKEPTRTSGEAPAAGRAEADEQAYKLGRGDGAAAAAQTKLPDATGTSCGRNARARTGSRQERLLHEFGVGY